MAFCSANDNEACPHEARVRREGEARRGASEGEARSDHKSVARRLQVRLQRNA